jgi:phage terminase large subunit-like protein
VATSWKLLTKQQKSATEPWMRNKADELAVKNGCWFDEVKAAFMIWWVERFCRLYEGEGFADQPVIMMSTANQPNYDSIPELLPSFYDDNGNPIPRVLDFYRERMKWHNAMFHSGAFMHWQFECHARIYGWQRQAAPRWQSLGVRQVRRFRKARVWIPKKSGKTPSLGFNTLYLTVGDGEPGAKSFIAALDGGQAIRVWEHVYQMCEQSPELKGDSKVNLNNHRISFRSNKSMLEPLSSNNSRNQKSKEGLNGNMIIDETHVVNRAFMNRLKFAGASRPQPMDIAYSTAGNEPEGYGKAEWDTGEAINAGELPVDNFFHQSYHAPQNLTAEQMKKDPEKYIRMANPAIDHTVGMEELLPAFYECMNSPADFSEYAMYRLNMWQHSSQVWLAAGIWSACGYRGFQPEELQDRQWVLGLDLARKFDLVAMVPASPNNEESVDIVEPMFWCNEARIKELAVHYPRFLEWVEMGLIKVNPGDVTDMRAVKRDIRKFCQRRNVIGIVYDATYAETLIQELVSGEFDADGKTTVAGLPIGEQAISQGMMTQTGPVADFENDIKRKALRQDENEVLTWQFGHATVREDSRGHRLIQKENRKSFRTVDGCQAAVMARWGVMDCKEWVIQTLDHYAKNNVEYV